MVILPETMVAILHLFKGKIQNHCLCSLSALIWVDLKIKFDYVEKFAVSEMFWLLLTR